MELFETNAIIFLKNFLNKSVNLLLSLQSIEENLASTAFLGETALFDDVAGQTIGHGDMWQNHLNIILDDIAIFVKIVTKLNK